MTLVERQDQIALLRRLAAESASGRGRTALITGSVASGKTELLRTVVEHVVHSGGRHLGATASEAERDLPTGVIGQLFHHADLPLAELQRVDAVLADVSRAWSVYGADVGAIRQATAAKVRGLALTLLRLAETGPLLITIDDTHHVDEASWQCVSYLVRRLATAPVFLVLAGDNSTERAYPPLRRDLLGQPGYAWLRVGCLSPAGVTELLTQEFGERVADEISADVHRISGGNPLLAKALIQDARQASPAGPVRLVVRDNFAHAVMGVLFRADAVLRDVARALAILPGATTVEEAGRFLELDAAGVREAVNALERTGLLANGRYPDARCAAAVVNSMTSAERIALHREAARFLHRCGAPPGQIARHVLAAGYTEGEWVLPVLRQAAERAVPDGDLEFALACLRWAEQVDGDPTDRAAVRQLLARLEWRHDPAATAARHLDAMVADVAEGRLPGGAALLPLAHLLWFGRVDEAAELFATARSRADQDDATRQDLEFARLWYNLCYPAHAARFAGPDTSASDPHRLLTTQQHTRAILLSVGSLGVGEGILREAEQLLQQTSLADITVGPLTVALLTLVFGDQLETAAQWCDPLIEEAQRRQATTWQALFTAVRGEIAVRQGELPRAEQCVLDAFKLMEPSAWGVFVALPLGTMLRATTAAGKLGEAVDYLRMTVPAIVFDTPLGLHYLHARGRFHLANGSHRAALRDFRTCGDLMSRWGFDVPGLVAWRAEAASACLQLGEERQAGRLAQEQLARLGPGASRTRGVALRLLAAASDERKKPALLNEAVRALKESGDRLELAHALADLSQALNAVGDSTRARMVLRTADRIANRCHAFDPGGPVRPTPLGAVAQPEEEWSAPPNGAAAGLSSAERRVVVLAAAGQTNREIARKLFVTVSTVEQHLTRAYRKLDVTRRTDLSAVLQADVVLKEPSAACER